MSSFLSNILAGAAKALGQVESIEAVATQDLMKIANGESDYEAGKAVVLGTISESGHAGKIYAVVDGSPLAAALEGRKEISIT